MIGYIVLCGIIIIQLIIIGFLIDEWNKVDKKNRAYYKRIRYEFDSKLKKYIEELTEKDEMIRQLKGG